MRERVFTGGSRMAELMREVDWDATALGPVTAWSTSLKTTVGVLLGNRFPMCLFWGPTLCNLNNDAYVPILGDKHPASLGAPATRIWPEIWDIIGPQAESVLSGGPATWNEHLLLPMRRKGFLEETFFTFSYSPVPDDDGSVGGVLVTCQETTSQVQDDRQLRMLRDLAAQTTLQHTPEAACDVAAAVLGTDAQDVPFALLYLVNAEGTVARLASHCGIEQTGLSRSWSEIRLSVSTPPAADPWRLHKALQTGERTQVPLDADLPVPRSAFGATLERAVVLPLARPGVPTPWGFLVAGVSPHRMFDERYQSLFRLSADHVAASIANARAYDEERRRAEALAELDRAKTQFFANVSHEFRTPLTLMLGPVEEALSAAEPLDGASLEAVHRNTLRLLRLVNTLLDFSRLESGRARSLFRPTDLAALTGDLASAFRSAIESGGLRFDVTTDPLPTPVYVDRDLWETILLNLLSNAFKFTLDGHISVVLGAAAQHVVLEVADTGIGIEEHDLERIFDRFHRVEGARGRTHEGTGIGLSLVKDLVTLHGGSIEVSSQPGRGTTFRVSVPFGTTHLPPDRIGQSPESAREPTQGAVRSFVAEALRWLPDTNAAPDTSVLPVGAPRVLVVDDNADMRAYLTRLLSDSCVVDTANDGVDALEAARRNPPDLVLTDVMTPRLDGFGLLRALRADPVLARIPVVMVSARAGDASRVEGLDAGADDYVVKPFSARELVKRVRMQLDRTVARKLVEEQAEEIDRARRDAERARALAEAANQTKDEFLAMLGHELRNPLSPIVTALQLLRARGMDTHEQRVIERQVDHVVRLVDDLLDVSRITRGKVELHKTRQELGAAVLRGLEIAGPLLEQRRQRIETQIQAEGVVVEIDADRIAQVVSNLLTNAAKYSEPGTLVRVQVERHEQWARLRVIDEGAGLSQEVLERIFETFFQPQQSLARSSGGLGLGLAIVRSLVELHGGTVRASSEGLGRGSTFEVTLPLATETTTEGARPASPDTTLQPTAVVESDHRRVLIVDDNSDSAETLAELLRAVGHTVTVAHDGSGALAVAGDLLPDVCLVDIGLPVMDGYELARRLRSAHGSTRVRLIALTGYGQDADRRRSVEAGFDLHLVKPVTLEVVDLAIRSH